MRHILLLLLVFASASGCRQIETITTKTTIRVDSVQVPLEVPGHSFAESFAWADTLFFEDARLSIRIVPDTSGHLPADVEAFAPNVPLLAEADARHFAPMPRFRIEAEVKPDTLEVTVAERTITTETEHVRYKKQMPWWGWMITGIAVFFLLGWIVLLKEASRS
jgi:hypothetical protein